MILQAGFMFRKCHILLCDTEKGSGRFIGGLLCCTCPHVGTKIRLLCHTAIDTTTPNIANASWFSSADSY